MFYSHHILFDYAFNLWSDTNKSLRERHSNFFTCSRSFGFLPLLSFEIWKKKINKNALNNVMMTHSDRIKRGVDRRVANTTRYVYCVQCIVFVHIYKGRLGEIEELKIITRWCSFFLSLTGILYYIILAVSIWVSM